MPSETDNSSSAASASAPAAERARPAAPRVGWAALLVIPLLVVAVYLPGFGTFEKPKQYVNWDDDIFIRDNPDLHSGRGLMDIWTRPDPIRNYYPVTHTTHWLEFRVWWAWPPGTYAINVLLHAANALLVFALVRTLGLGARAAWLASLLFALHPMLAASVAWLAERKNLLGTLFSLAALIAYLKYCRDGRLGPYRLSLVYMLAGLLSKTAVMTMPASMLAADWLILRRRGWKTVWPLLPMMVAGAVLVWIKSGQEHAAGHTFAEPWPLRPLAVASALWQYLLKLAWPLDLRTIYPRWHVEWSPVWIAPLAALLLVLVTAWLLRRRIGGVVQWCGVHFLITLLPVSGIAAFGYLYHAPLADHFVYLAAVGPVIAAAWAAERLAGAAVRGWTPRAIGVYAAGAAACAALGWLTLQRVPVWDGPVAFWSHTLAGNPDYEFARRRLAQSYNDERRFEEALPVWRQVIAARPADDPNSAQDHSNYGAALSELGRTAEAIAAFERAIALDPNFAPAHFNLGFTLYRRGQGNAAIRHLEEAARLRPDYWEARNVLTELYVRAGDYKSAHQHARRAVEAYSYNPDLQLALAHTAARAGEHDEAVRACDAALRLRPNWPAAQTELAWLLATAPDAGQRRPGEAVKLAEMAVRATQGAQARPVFALAAAHAAAGRFDQALDAAAQAAQVARAAGDRALAAEIEQAISQFRRSQPLNHP
ncbi:MAG: tetratricopeptide repeat protein [Phycisphaerae bacterium]|jgi:Flp pilus assembly protein TadD|nr:tetratricopeptide repeat protein [Phycisphaerae bacterium]MCZ2400175.1 tetratricopeptide repeat protein [Phycisphaerae bacterium]